MATTFSKSLQKHIVLRGKKIGGGGALFCQGRQQGHPLLSSVKGDHGATLLLGWMWPHLLYLGVFLSLFNGGSFIIFYFKLGVFLTEKTVHMHVIGTCLISI
jgi:hypothetical protein